MAPTIFQERGFTIKQVLICSGSNKYKVYFVVLMTNAEYFGLQ